LVILSSHCQINLSLTTTRFPRSSALVLRAGTHLLVKQPLINSLLSRLSLLSWHWGSNKALAQRYHKPKPLSGTYLLEASWIAEATLAITPYTRTVVKRSYILTTQHNGHKTCVHTIQAPKRDLIPVAHLWLYLIATHNTRVLT